MSTTTTTTAIAPSSSSTKTPETTKTPTTNDHGDDNEDENVWLSLLEQLPPQNDDLRETIKALANWEDSMRCYYCNNLFRSPIIAIEPCHHCFCQQCFQAAWEKALQNDNDDDDHHNNNNNMTCEICEATVVRSWPEEKTSSDTSSSPFFSFQRNQGLEEALRLYRIVQPLLRRVIEGSFSVPTKTSSESEVAPLAAAAAAMSGNNFKATWFAYFQRLVEFKNKYGHTRVRKRDGVGDAEFKKFADWVRNQRYLLAKRKEVQGGEMAPMYQERIDLLNSIGFGWSEPRLSDNSADSNVFHSLRDSTTNDKTGGDITNVKQEQITSQYNEEANNSSQDNDDTSTNQDKEETEDKQESQVEQGTSINQIKANANQVKSAKHTAKKSAGSQPSVNKFQAQWDIMFQQLLDYYNKTGDSNITDRTGDHKKLHDWVRNQKYMLSRKIKEGRLSPTSADRVGRLEKINFPWKRGTVNSDSPEEPPAAPAKKVKLNNNAAAVTVRPALPQTPQQLQPADENNTTLAASLDKVLGVLDNLVALNNMGRGMSGASATTNQEEKVSAGGVNSTPAGSSNNAMDKKCAKLERKLELVNQQLVDAEQNVIRFQSVNDDKMTQQAKARMVDLYNRKVELEQGLLSILDNGTNDHANNRKAEDNNKDDTTNMFGTERRQQLLRSNLDRKLDLVTKQLADAEKNVARFQGIRDETMANHARARMAELFNEKVNIENHLIDMDEEEEEEDNNSNQPESD